MALWEAAAAEPFGGGRGSLGTVQKDCAATAGTVEGLWHCGRKLQQSLSGGQTAVSEPYKSCAATVVEGLWHCGRKLQQSLKEIVRPQLAL